MLLDVTDDASVVAAASTVEADGGLDVLVNNAGIQVELGTDGAAAVTADMMRETFDTNVFGIVRVLHAFLPLLRRSPAPVVVNVSSGLASFTRVTTLGGPGYTGTDLNHHGGHQTVEEGAEIIVRMAQVTPDGPTGGYFDAHGTLPW